VLTIEWSRPPGGMTSRLVPQLSSHIRLAVTDLATGGALVEDVLQRPDAPPWVTEASYELQASPMALLTAAAYPVDPSANPDATAQARGSMHITIPGGATGYPLDGAPGDPVTVVMGSTVANVRITRSEQAPAPAGQLGVLIGTTLQLLATAHDAAGSMVLVPGFEWASGDAAVASVDGTGLATGREAGWSEITATEVESGVSGAVTLEVFMPAITGTVTGLGGHPRALVTVRVLDPDTEALVRLTRTQADGTFRLPVRPQSTSYRVIAEKTGEVVYEPASGFHDVRVEHSDVANVDFVVTGPPLGPDMGEIRGFIYTGGEDPVQGVVVSAGATTAHSDRNGEFTLVLEAHRTYTVTPGPDGFTFDPVSQAVELPQAVVYTDDFTAIAR
jgi:hypothetical protein